MALRNLKKEIISARIGQQEIARLIGTTVSVLKHKLAEKIQFECIEMFAIRDEYFPRMSIDYLFQSDGDKPTYEEQLAAYAELVSEYARKRKETGECSS